MKKIAEKCNGLNASLSDLRACFTFLIGFSGFLRCYELIHIQRKHIRILYAHMEIFIPSRENDKCNEGHTIFIAKTSNITCPVAITVKYLQFLPISSDQFLVCRLTYSHKGHIAQKHAISYTRVREIMLHSLKEILPDISGYGTHSLKRGAATSAFN